MRLYIGRFSTGTLHCDNATRISELPFAHNAVDMPMITHIRTEADLDAALAALTRADPRFAALIAKSGRPPLRRRPTALPA